jgi:hypothetical protein
MKSIRKGEKMEKEEFEKYLKRGGRSPSVIQQCLHLVGEYETYLLEHKGGVSIEEARPVDLEEFVKWIEQHPKSSVKNHLWALRYYFDFTVNRELRDCASKLRQERIKRKPFSLKEFRDVDQDCVGKFASIGIVDVAQMLEAGSTPVKRQSLSKKTGVPIDTILEFVKLSDLARITGLKGIRARLYYDAGVDTIEKLAEWDPEELRVTLNEFVERTGFKGIAPLPKEVKHTVETARKLTRVVEYD